MKTIITAALGIAMLASAPASAQTFVMVIGKRPTAEATRAPASAELEQRIEMAIDKACERPFIRDLVGQQLYAECRTDTRAEIDAKLAVSEEGSVTIALR